MHRSATCNNSSMSDDVTKCFCCSKVYSSPRLLPCVHTFCLPCLERHGLEKKPGDTASCPLCLHQFRLSAQGFVGLPRNLFIEELTEVDKVAMQALLDTQCDQCFELVNDGHQQNISLATVHCNECSRNFCAECCRKGSLHNNNNTTLTASDSATDRKSHHTIIDLRAHLRQLYKRDVTYCDLHPDEPICHYCFDCRTTLCVCCKIDGGHRIHRCASVEQAASEFDHQLRGDVQKVVSRYKKCREIIDKEQTERQGFLDHVDQIERDIRKKGEEIKQLVDSHVTELINELTDVRVKTMQNLDGVRCELDRFLTTADSFVRYTEAIRERGTQLDKSRSGHDLLARAATLETAPFVTSGTDYRTPLITFQPWYDLVNLLTNDQQNVVGSVIASKRNEDGAASWNYCLKPSPVKTVHQDAKAILGVAAMSGHVFVVRVDSSDIELYSEVTWSLQRLVPVPGLHSPTDLVVAKQLERVFVCDWSNSYIHFTDICDVDDRRRQVNGHELYDDVNCNGGRGNGRTDECELEPNTSAPATSWKVENNPWSMSISQTGNSLLVICDQAQALCEYTFHGSLKRRVVLSAELNNPRHAVLLATGQFVVSFTDYIYAVGSDGKRSQPKSTSGINKVNISGRLAVDTKGQLIVLDVDCKRVVQFAADSLIFIREIVPRDNQLRYTARFFLDSTRGRMYIADNELTIRSRLSMRAKFWGKTGRLVVYETNISNRQGMRAVSI